MPMCQAYGCTKRPSNASQRMFFEIQNPQKKQEKSKKWLHSIGTYKFTFSTYKYHKNRVVCKTTLMRTASKGKCMLKWVFDRRRKD